MYAKLYARITESSLMEEAIDVRYTFLGLLAITDPTGVVIGTDVAIARRLNMPLEQFQNAVARLSAPDPDSNSKELEGRRIVPSEGERGYRLVNYLTYRNIRDEDQRRKYQANYMANYRANGKDKSRPVNLVNLVNNGKPRLAQAEEEEKAKEEADTSHTHNAVVSVIEPRSITAPPGPTSEEIYATYPRQVARKPALKAIGSQLRKHDAAYLLAQTKLYAETVAGADQQFIPYPATWFNGERFTETPAEWAPRSASARKQPEANQVQETLTTPIL